MSESKPATDDEQVDDATRIRITTAIAEMGFYFTFGHALVGPLWSFSFGDEASHDEADVHLFAQQGFLRVVGKSRYVAKVTDAQLRALMKLNANLIVVRIAMDDNEELAFFADIRLAEVDRTSIQRAISYVLRGIHESIALVEGRPVNLARRPSQ